MSGNSLAALGSLMAHETRAELLTVLMDGRAHTGTELARHLRVAPSTVSEHLTRLLDAGIVTVAAQGRHRYFQLRSDETARLLESIGALAPAGPISNPRSKTPSAVAYARSCYDHLAGEVAVLLYNQLHTNGFIGVHEHDVKLMPAGVAALAELGIETDVLDKSRRPTVRSCLDWTERRHHLVGGVAAALFETMLKRRWLTRGTQPRAIRVTRRGKEELLNHFGLSLS